jgi:two-component system OmpR family response regulator/two-component system response regulator QseB
MRLLLVEDDAQLGRATQAGLAEAGFAVDWVRDGVAADAALSTEDFAAVVLDLGLPRRSGLDVLARLRASGKKTPVLILTARDAIEDRVKGLDTGADDYVVKPFRLEELAARLRALVRRSHGAAAPVLKVGPITLDPATRAVTCRGRSVELSTRELGVLRELMLNAGRVLSREQLQSRVYRWGEEVESNAIEVHVHHLRRKLFADAIRTIRGVGYMMPATPSA